MQKTRHQRLVKRMEDRRNAFERSGRQIDLATRLKKSDVRYWQGVAVGLWVHSDSVYRWWAGLHWMQRESWFRQHLALLCVSKADMDETAEENKEFFSQTVEPIIVKAIR